MEDKEYQFYNNLKNWDFDNINYTSVSLTNFDIYDILNKIANSTSKILDLGTGGGEKVIKYYPHAKEIVATDYSKNMIETAKENLKKSGRRDITFKVMDNLHMTTPKDYFDIVVARHTPIDAKQIYKTLKKGGVLIVRGVDKLDAWALKRMFNKGQAFFDNKAISEIDYENIIDAGFKNVELVPIHVREYFKTKEDLIKLLIKTPIIDDFSNYQLSDNPLDINIIDSYIKENTFDDQILLVRRYYGITAIK